MSIRNRVVAASAGMKKEALFHHVKNAAQDVPQQQTPGVLPAKGRLPKNDERQIRNGAAQHDNFVE